MKTDKLKVYFFEFILVAILAFALFVPSLSRTVLSVGLTVAAVIISIMIKKRNIVSIYKKQIIIMFVIFSAIYLVVFYLMRFIFWIL